MTFKQSKENLHLGAENVHNYCVLVKSVGRSAPHINLLTYLLICSTEATGCGVLGTFAFGRWLYVDLLTYSMQHIMTSTDVQTTA